MARLNKEFEIDGLKFVIQKHHKRSEFEGKYELLMWSDQHGWMYKATDDTISYLYKYAEENALYW